MNKKKVLMLIVVWVVAVFMGLLTIYSALSLEFNYYINQTKLPFNTTENIFVNGIENLSINISYGLFLNGVNNLLFITNTTNFTVNIDVPLNTLVNNYSSIVRIYNGSINDYSVNITFNFYVIDNIPKPTVDFIQGGQNEYTYIFCDYSLPLNTTLRNIAIGGYSGQTIQADFNSSFFNMPNEFIIPSSNISILDIGITLGQLTPKTYKELIRFSKIGDFTNISFTFEILDCILPPPDLTNILQACTTQNLTVDNYISCLNAQADFYSRLYVSAIEAQQNKVVNRTVVEYINQTQYQPVLELDNPDVVNALTQIPLTWKQVQSDSLVNKKIIQDQQQQIDLLQQKLTDEFSDLSLRVNQSVKPLVDENNILKNTVNYLQNNYIKKSTLWFWTIMITITSGLVWLYIEVQKDNLI